MLVCTTPTFIKDKNMTNISKRIRLIIGMGMSRKSYGECLPEYARLPCFEDVSTGGRRKIRQV